MIELKVRQVGNSLGVLLPAAAVEMLQVRKGDRLALSRTPDGYRLSTATPELVAQLEAARQGMRKYKNALRELAK